MKENDRKPSGLSFQAEKKPIIIARWPNGFEPDEIPSRIRLKPIDSHIDPPQVEPHE